MARDVISLFCPCCGQKLYIDTRSGKAYSTDPESSGVKADLDQVLADSHKDKARLEDEFLQAMDQHQRAKDLLEQQFSDAAKKAAKDKDKGKRPPSPFDLE